MFAADPSSRSLAVGERSSEETLVEKRRPSCLRRPPVADPVLEGAACLNATYLMRSGRRCASRGSVVVGRYGVSCWRWVTCEPDLQRLRNQTLSQLNLFRHADEPTSAQSQDAPEANVVSVVVGG